MRNALLLALAGAALTLAACGGDDETTTAPAADTAEEASAEDVMEEKEKERERNREQAASKDKASGTEIKLASSQFGEVIFDGAGQAIYLFDKEKTSESECYGECAVEWPPVLTQGAPAAGKGVDEKLLGTTKRDDGTTQVTYNGHPLYYYFDEGPNEVRCHNVPGFGGLWLVLDAQGNAV